MSQENLSSGFLNRSDTNQAVVTKDDVELEISYLECRGFVQSMLLAKTKALISCAVTAHLIFTFVFAYALRKHVHAIYSNISRLQKC